MAVEIEEHVNPALGVVETLVVDTVTGVDIALEETGVDKGAALVSFILLFHHPCAAKPRILYPHAVPFCCPPRGTDWVFYSIFIIFQIFEYHIHIP